MKTETRPEIMKDIESQAIEYAEALNDIADVLDMPTGATAAEIVERARNRWANGIHTCHERCTRERCVERRKLKTMREALDFVKMLLETVKGGGKVVTFNDGDIYTMERILEENDQSHRSCDDKPNPIES